MSKDTPFNTSYSQAHPAVLTVDGKRVAQQIVSCLTYSISINTLKKARLADIGCSNGAITYHLAQSVQHASGFDTDGFAITSGRKKYNASNLALRTFNGSRIPLPDNSADIVICRRTYASAKHPARLVQEIKRIMTQDALCYLEGINGLWPIDHEYNIPLLLYLPLSWQFKIIKLTSHQQYYRSHFSNFWQLQRALSDFTITRMTPLIIKNPQRFHFTKLTSYQPITSHIPLSVLRTAEPLLPTFIWILKKKSPA